MMTLLYCILYMLINLAIIGTFCMVYSKYLVSLDLITMAVMYFHSNTVYTVVMNSYYLSLFAMKSRLVILNECIRFVSMQVFVIISTESWLYRRIFVTSTHHRTISKNGNIQGDEVKGSIKRMALIYDRIVEIVETLNFCFSIQV